MGVVMWTGYAGPEWAWPKAHSLLFLNSSCAATPRKGGSSEQISQVITYHMALSVSHRMGSQIPFSGASRIRGSSRGRGDPRDLWIRWLRSGGDECAERSCAPHRYDSTETGHFGCHGTGEGPDSDQDIQAVSQSEEKALLGQSFLVSGVLC